MRMWWLIVLIWAVSDDAWNQEAIGARVRQVLVPEGDGKPVLLDGLFSPGEWDDALIVPIHDGAKMLLKTNSGHVFIGLKFADPMGVITDLYLSSDDKIVFQLHSSGALAERSFALPLLEEEPGYVIGYSKGWDANEIKADRDKRDAFFSSGRPGGIDGYLSTLFESDGKEFQVLLSKFGGARIKLRLTAGNMNFHMIYPKQTDLNTTQDWMELVFEEHQPN